MEKTKVEYLMDDTLDWFVAVALGMNPFLGVNNRVTVYSRDGKGNITGNSWFRPHFNYAQGGPIMDQKSIDTYRVEHGSNHDWVAERLLSVAGGSYVHVSQRGRTRLIAAMRCIVASELGKEVDVPAELAPKEFRQYPINLDLAFADVGGELGGLWGQLEDAENVLAEKLKDLPRGTAVALDNDVWFLVVEEATRKLCIGQFDNGVATNVHSRLDYGLDWVDVGEDDLLKAIERVKLATEKFNTVAVTSFDRN